MQSAPANVIYVSDFANHCIRAVPPLGAPGAGVVTTFAGACGVRGFASGQFNNPTGVRASTPGSVLFVADSGNARVRLVDVPTGAMTTLAGGGLTGFTPGNVVRTRSNAVPPANAPNPPRHRRP